MTQIFYHEQPLFVNTPFVSHGTLYKHGDEFKWKTRGIGVEKVTTLFQLGMLRHDEIKAERIVVGDGLESLDLPQLLALVDSINAEVAKHPRALKEDGTIHPQNYAKIKCKKHPQSAGKTMGHIRSWRGRTAKSLGLNI